MKERIQAYFEGNYRLFYEKYLENVKRAKGDEYKAICPFHNDTNPSFDFNDQSGKYYCHGCVKGGNAFHFYGKLHSLDTRREFRKILRGIADDFGIPWENGNKAKTKKGNEWPSMQHLKKTYDYTDENGHYLFTVLRFEEPGKEKTFRQGQRKGQDYIRHIKGVRRVIYQLPKVIKAKEVIIPEGEKDVDTVNGMGFTGTTNPMGAGKWRDEYNESLRGKTVVLCPDNDQESRAHMAQVGAALNGIAKSLKWIDLPDLPNKGDVTDWAARFEDKAEAAEALSCLIDKAGPYEPPKKVSLEDTILTAYHHRFNSEPVSPI